MHDLSILAIIWSSVFVASFVAHRTRLTPVLWYLFLGSTLVNLGILPTQMPLFIVNFAELGIITIMFALGFEEDTSNFLKSIKRSWGIAVFGALTPFAVAYSATFYFWGDKHIALLCGLAMGRGGYSILALLLIALLVGLLADFFGFHPAIGAYMAGLIIKREYFDYHHDQNIDFHDQAKQMINNIAFAWVGPVFFVTLGSKLIFDAELFLQVLPYSLILFAGMFIGQILSAGLAARAIGHFDKPTSLLIGFGMLGRAELAFVVLEIAYVQHNIVSLEGFYTLMLTAFLLNISVPICIRWWKTHYLPT